MSVCDRSLMFEGAPAVQVRVGFGHRQFQRCARARKSMEIPFPARSTIARLSICPSFTLILLWIVTFGSLSSRPQNFCFGTFVGTGDVLIVTISCALSWACPLWFIVSYDWSCVHDWYCALRVVESVLLLERMRSNVELWYNSYLSTLSFRITSVNCRVAAVDS